jgi:uncharacterized protein (TIGR00299 family) protein
MTGGRLLWVDARAGIAGDMLLGALLDAGASVAGMQAAVDAVMPGTVRIATESVRRAGMRATKASVEVLVEDLPHRHWLDIRSMLLAADLLPAVRDRALAVFSRLAQAEARAHGVDVEEVHFHEVGAWDSIADIVAVAAGMAELGVDRVTAGTVALGSGSVRTAHGEMPVPAPAVLELSAGWRVLAGGEGELATPTGMAVIAALAEACEDLPELVVEAVGVGAGTRDTPGRANVVRVVLGVPAPARSVPEAGDAVVLEANVDDLDPRLWPGVLSAVLAAGAADAWLVPILMKKGRPAHTLCVLAAPGLATDLQQRIFSLVPTLGVRATTVHRAALERLWRTVDVGGAAVRVKVGHARGVVVTATPELEDVVRAAAETGAAERTVLARAVAAAEAAGLTPGAALEGG